MSGERSALHPYEKLAELALAGREKQNRTGVNTIGIFGHQMRFDLSRGEFPLITTKKVFTRGIFEELKFFIKGETNNNVLTDKNVHIWDAWALDDRIAYTVEERYRLLADKLTEEQFSAVRNEANALEGDQEARHAVLDKYDIPRDYAGPRQGDLGPIYGEIWRRFPAGIPVDVLKECLENNGESRATLTDALCDLINNPKYQAIDQLKDLVKNLREKPFSRRHLVSAWAPTVLPDESVSPQENVLEGRQCLAACHTFWQVYVESIEPAEAFDLRLRNYRHIIACLDFDIMNCNDAIDLILNATGAERDAMEDSLRTHRFRRDELMEKKIQAELEQDQIISRFSAGDHGCVPNKRLSMQLYQRSADIPLGVPFNIASYAALLQLLAMKCDMIAGDFIHTFGDAHVYMNQVELLKEQIQRTPKRPPALLIDGVGFASDWSDVDNYKFEVIGYDCHPAIKYPGAAV